MEDLLTALTPAIIALFGALLTFLLNRLAGAFTAATGLAIEKKHLDSLHSAFKSGMEAALIEKSPEAGLDVLKEYAIKHVKESVPDAIEYFVPGDGVLDRLALRYYGEAMERLGINV